MSDPGSMDECTERSGGTDRSTDHQRRQQVCVVGESEATRERIICEMTPAYEIQSVTAADPDIDAMEPDVDCAILATPVSEDVAVAFLSAVRDSFARLPIVLFAPREASTLIRRFVRYGGSDIVYADAGESEMDGQRSDVDRLRQRVDVHCRQRVPEIADTVLGVAGTLMGATPDEVDTKIEWGLKSVGERLDAVCCLVYRYDADADQLVETHSWTPTGTLVDSSTATRPDRLSATSFPGFEEQIKTFDRVTLPGVTDEQATLESSTELSTAAFEGDDSRYLERRGIESLVALPIVIDWELDGMLVVGTPTHRSWPKSVVTQLSTLADLIGDTIHERRQRQELEAQNQRLERFASVISHDLQNPLNVISGYADVVLRSGDVEPVTEIAAAADRMDRLLSDMLTLTREGDSLGEVEPVELETVVRDAWNTVDTGDAELVTEGLEQVEADDGRLQQAMENLVRNAIEHGGDVSTIRVEWTDTGFAIEDDGEGIPPEKREEVFKEGYTDNEGTGLGLTIVETVVNAHGWSIDIVDGRTGGARFEVTLAPEAGD
jgi:signal transduction histidine kinase